MDNIEETIIEKPRSKYSDPNRGPDLRRRADGKKRGFQVAEMWDSHHEIARRILLGQKGVDIAKALNCTAQTVSNVRNSPVVKEKIELMQAARDVGALDLADQIKELAPIALGRVKEAITIGEVNGQTLSGAEILKQSGHILDRELGKATQRIDTRSMHGHFTMDDIQKMKDRAKELSGANDILPQGTVIDA